MKNDTVEDRLSLLALKARALEAAVTALVDESNDIVMARGVAHLSRELADDMAALSSDANTNAQQHTRRKAA